MRRFPRWPDEPKGPPASINGGFGHCRQVASKVVVRKNTSVGKMEGDEGFLSETQVTDEITSSAWRPFPSG